MPNPLSAKAAFLDTALIAKPICSRNPVHRIVAVGAVFDIKKVGKCSIKA